MSDAYDQLPERLQRFVRPSLRIRTVPAANEPLRLGQSRIGGTPDLPPGFQWPKYGGLSLSFVAQFDLAELAHQPTVLPLPKDGNLAFFYDSKRRTSGMYENDRGSAVVAYFPGPASALERTE